jgi:general secretion pathway protein G
MKAKSGFTLVEILIVVVILGILAAIVIPQFSEASTEAKESRLVSDLQSMRSQIELYKIQHNDDLPGVGTASFTDAMTMYTDVAGALALVQAPADGVYGPYIQKIPTNPWNDLDTVTTAAADPGVAGDAGWFFNSTTGHFRADDTLSCADGTPHIDL